ncbi:MAG: glycosyltransferase [Gammaproteobacteria bacterium]|nr:MAG: glycosyltransferase [Gammaproteobacteria bacterium]
MSATLVHWLALSGLGLWIVILLLPWRPWSTRESLDGDTTITDADLSDVTVLVPARNEARHIAATLEGLRRQGHSLEVVVIDDHSDDDTSGAAARVPLDGLRIVRPPPLEEGWSGKLWALQAGLPHASRPLLLLLDADILLRPGTIPALRAKLLREGLDLVSLMARLRMENAWERCLMPAFIYFFKLLYPFSLANSRSPLVAAAAGGCILMRRQRLDQIGGFHALRDALIDDCTLAARVKATGGRTWLGLTHSAVSQRGYDGLAPIWEMVARTAFTQLRYSTTLLVSCTLLMTIAFPAPVLAILAGGRETLIGLGALALMLLTYLPVLDYYRLPRSWLLTLPLAGCLYLAMTWSSAWRYWRGHRSRWKGRVYAR